MGDLGNETFIEENPVLYKFKEGTDFAYMNGKPMVSPEIVGRTFLDILSNGDKFPENVFNFAAVNYEDNFLSKEPEDNQIIKYGKWIINKNIEEFFQEHYEINKINSTLEYIDFNHDLNFQIIARLMYTVIQPISEVSYLIDGKFVEENIANANCEFKNYCGDDYSNVNKFLDDIKDGAGDRLEQFNIQVKNPNSDKPCQEPKQITEINGNEFIYDLFLAPKSKEEKYVSSMSSIIPI